MSGIVSVGNNKNYGTIPRDAHFVAIKYLDIPNLLNYRRLSSRCNRIFQLFIQPSWRYVAEIGDDLKVEWKDVVVLREFKRAASTELVVPEQIREQSWECDREAFASFKQMVLHSREFTRISRGGDLREAFRTLCTHETDNRRPSNLLRAALPPLSEGTIPNLHEEKALAFARRQKIQAAIISDLFKRDIPATGEDNVFSLSSALQFLFRNRPVFEETLRIITMHPNCKNIDTRTLNGLAERQAQFVEEKSKSDRPMTEIQAQAIDGMLKVIATHETNSEDAVRMGKILGHALISATFRKNLTTVRKLLHHKYAGNIPLDDTTEENGFVQALKIAVENAASSDDRSRKIVEEILSFSNNHVRERLSGKHLETLLTYALQGSDSELIRVLGSCRGAQAICPRNLAILTRQEIFAKRIVNNHTKAIVEEILRFPKAEFIQGSNDCGLLDEMILGIDNALAKGKIDPNCALELTRLALNLSIERKIHITILAYGSDCEMRYPFGVALSHAAAVGNLAFVEQVCAHFSARVPVEGEHGLIKALQEALSSTQENRIAIARKLVQFPQFPKERAEELIPDEALRKQIFSNGENR